MLQFVPLFVIDSNTAFTAFLQNVLCAAGNDPLLVQRFTDFQHQGIKALDSDKVALFVRYHILNILIRQVAKLVSCGIGRIQITPIDATGQFGIGRFQKSHQTVISAAIADDDRGISIEGIGQGITPLVLQVTGGLRAVERCIQQSSVNLGHDGTLDIGLDVAGQRFMAHNQRLLVRVQEQGIFHQIVKIGGDDQIVLGCFRQHQGQGVITNAGLTLLHLPLQIAVAVAAAGIKTPFINIKIVFTGHGCTTCHGLLPRCHNFVRVVTEQFFPIEFFAQCHGFFTIHSRGDYFLFTTTRPVGLFSHEAVHPLHLQLITRGDAGFHRRTGAQDEAEALAIGT